MIPRLKRFVPSRAGWLIFGPLSAQVVVALSAISDWVAMSVLFVVVSGLLSETHFGATYLFSYQDRIDAGFSENQVGCRSFLSELGSSSCLDGFRSTLRCLQYGCSPVFASLDKR